MGVPATAGDASAFRPRQEGAAVPHQDDIDAYRRLVGEDTGFQRRVWAVQRAGWAALAVLVLLALAGGLGDGPLSTAEATSTDGALRIRHGRVVRQDSATRWDITLPPGREALTIRTAALPWTEVTNIQPAPDRQARGEDWLALHFAATQRVRLTLEPIRPGFVRVDVSAGDAAAGFDMLVLP